MLKSSREKVFFVLLTLIWGVSILCVCRTVYSQTKESPPAQNTAASEEIKKKIRTIFSLGVSYYRRGQYEEALSAFQIALNFDPQNKNIENFVELCQDRIGKMLLEKEKAKQAVAEKLLKKRIYDLYAAGLYALQYHKLEDAANYFQEVLQLNSHHQGAWNNLVMVRSEMEREKKQEEAVAPQERGVSVPGEEIVRRQEPVQKEAVLLKEKEKRKRTLIEEESQKELNQLYGYAEKLLRLGRFQEAERELVKIENINPKYRNTQIYLADIFKIKEAEKREKEPSKYTLGPEDVLEISVLGHPELSNTVTVEPGGEIVLPLLREVIAVDGLTKDELIEKLKTVLAKYIKAPEVQIVITGYFSKKWYVLGSVGRRGEYPLGKTNLTLMEALYRAGLPIDGISAMRRVILVKPHKTSPKYRVINVFDILYNGRMQDNVRIEPGDIIYVPQTVLAKVSGIVAQVQTLITNTRTGLEDTSKAATAAKVLTPWNKTFGPLKRDEEH